jgi:hypothetical protein
MHLELVAAVGFLEPVHDTHPEVSDLLDRLGMLLPASGSLHVAGGTEEGMVRPLDFAPSPGRPVRRLFLHPEPISADLQRLVDDQQDDDGWRADFCELLTRCRPRTAWLPDRASGVHPSAQRLDLRGERRRIRPDL